jgi:hypothetical protein
MAVAEIPLVKGKITPPVLSGNSFLTTVNYLKIRRPDAYGPLVSPS